MSTYIITVILAIPQVIPPLLPPQDFHGPEIQVATCAWRAAVFLHASQISSYILFSYPIHNFQDRALVYQDLNLLASLLILLASLLILLASLLILLHLCVLHHDHHFTLSLEYTWPAEP
jgi:hypothetical protein